MIAVTAVATGSVDADGDVISYVYEWSKDLYLNTYVGNPLPASLTKKGDVWQVRVTASAGGQTLTPVLASVTIQNTLPTGLVVTVTPLHAADTTDTAGATCTTTATTGRQRAATGPSTAGRPARRRSAANHRPRPTRRADPAREPGSAPAERRQRAR